MAPKNPPSEATNIQNTINDIHLNILKLCHVPYRYGVYSHYVQRDLKYLQVYQYCRSKHNPPKIIEDKDHQQKSSKKTTLNYPDVTADKSSLLKATRRVAYCHIEKYGTPKASIRKVIYKPPTTLGSKTYSDILEEVEMVIWTKVKVRKVMKSIGIDPYGKKACHTIYKYTLIIPKA